MRFHLYSYGQENGGKSAKGVIPVVWTRKGKWHQVTEMIGGWGVGGEIVVVVVVVFTGPGSGWCCCPRDFRICIRVLYPCIFTNKITPLD